MSQTNIKLPDNWTGDTITILEGKAVDPKPERSIELRGTLQAPYQFLEFKSKNFEPKDCHLEVEYDAGRITFVANDCYHYGIHKVVGELTIDSILLQFKINSDHRWTIAEFLKFIKTMRYYFADRAAHQALVESLQKWSIKVERVITEHNDNRGNSNFQLETKVHQSAQEGGLITKFDLNIPIHQGYPTLKFTVEIGLDPKNTVVMLYLISDDLIELEIAERHKHIQTELKLFESFPCSKIVIS